VASGTRLLTRGLEGSFLATYDSASDSVVLSNYLTASPGDFDIDGSVDGADFLKWQRGETPTPLSATDLAAWKTSFGVSPSESVNSIGVPEPKTAMLLLVAAFAFGVRAARGIRE
jgi:hypothetical protein